MRRLDDLPVGTKIQLRSDIDDPETGHKKGDVVEATWCGTLPKRPSTVAMRSIPRRVRHEPVGSSACECGARFDTSATAQKHAEATVPAWKRVRFRYEGPEGRQLARPLDGHEMAFPVLEEDGSLAVVCECGWRFGAADLSRAGPVARDHVRAVVRARTGVR
jgi:hypothetical protein